MIRICTGCIRAAPALLSHYIVANQSTSQPAISQQAKQPSSLAVKQTPIIKHPNPGSTGGSRTPQKGLDGYADVPKSLGLPMLLICRNTFFMPPSSASFYTKACCWCRSWHKSSLAHGYSCGAAGETKGGIAGGFAGRRFFCFFLHK